MCLLMTCTAGPLDNHDQQRLCPGCRMASGSAPEAASEVAKQVAEYDPVHHTSQAAPALPPSQGDPQKAEVSFEYSSKTDPTFDNRLDWKAAFCMESAG